MLPDRAEIPPLEVPVEAPPEPARNPFWGYTDVAVFAGLLGASIVLLLIAAGLLASRQRLNEEPAFLLATQFVLYGFMYLSFLAVFRLRYDRPVLESLGWRRSNFNLLIAAVAGPLLALAVSGLASLLHTPKVDSPIDKLTNTPVTLVIFGLMAVTVAPLFEEMLFRGFIQPLLSRTFGVFAGVILTAGLFGALHAPEYSWAWQYVLAVSLAGMIFGWARARTNSIIPSTLMHGCYNLMFVLALAITKHS